MPQRPQDAHAGPERCLNQDLPAEVAGALPAADLTDFFAGCTAAHRNEYLKWIKAARQPETRRKRIGQAMKMLAAKRAEEGGRA